MQTRTRYILALAPLLFVLLLAGAYLLIDAWLEGAGGRRAVEAALAERLGTVVSLNGEFRVMLLPSIGVAGTDLVIGQPGSASEVARSGKYAVALALLPLLERKLLVESFDLAEGRFYVQRLQTLRDEESPGVEPDTLRLPEIRSLTVSDFRIHTGDGAPLYLERLAIEDFADGSAAPFELAVQDFGTVRGHLNWNADRAHLAADAVWSELVAGNLSLNVSAGLESGSGSLRAEWRMEPRGRGTPDLRLSAEYSVASDGVRFENLSVELAGQTVQGSGCLRTGGSPSLHIDLRAAAIDFDTLPDLGVLADAIPSRPDAPPEAPPDVDATNPSALALHLRLRAGEARFQGAVAREAVFGVGRAPDCSELEPTAARAAHSP